MKGYKLMKKIVNGITYDTETAKWIDTYDNDILLSHPLHFSEKLYCTPNGEFFLQRFGVSKSDHPIHQVGESIACGATIVPLSEDLATEWVEISCDIDTYYRVFCLGII